MLKTIASLLIGCLLCSTQLSAQSIDENQVASRVELLRKAMVSADTSSLKELTAEELSYGHSNGLVEDKAAFVEEYVTGKSVFTSLNFSEQVVRVVGDAAIVRHHFTGDTNNNKVPGKVDLVILLVWQKQHGIWKLLARQAAKMPVPVK